MTRAVVTEQPVIIENQDRNTPRTAGEQHLIDTLRHAPLPGWRVYEQPHLNGDRPDVVMVHPTRGVILIEVKDYNLGSGRYSHRSGQFCVLGNDGRWHSKRNPADQVRGVWDNILKMYSRRFLELEEAFGEKAWGVVETAIYFHHADRGAAAQVCGHPRNVRILDGNHLQAWLKGDFANSGLQTFEALAKYRESSFARGGHLQEFVRDLESWLNPAAYMQERRAPVSLTPDQQRRTVPKPGQHRRLKGAAGAGKTLVLASYAANLLAQRKRVLIVTFNITLRHYLRDLVPQQTPPEHWRTMRDKLVLLHYHDLLKWLAHSHGHKLEPISDDARPEEVNRILSEVWPEQVKGILAEARRTGTMNPDTQFDAVLIDEGQDFQHDWVGGLLPLLTTNDELMVAYDSLQNLYGRDLVWLDRGTRGLGFSGPPAELKTSQRLPRAFAEVSGHFARHFIDPHLPFDPTSLPPQTFFKHFLNWQNLPAETQPRLPSLVLSAIGTLMGPRFQAHPNDIAVITDSHETAIPVVEALRREEYRVAHVFDLSGQRDHRQRREEKWKFQPADGLIKVCTLHSFKGWEAPYLILLLSSTSLAREASLERARQAYVALTRVKTQADGASSALLVYNLDPVLNDGEVIVREVNQAQTGVLVPRRRPT